MMQAFRNAAKPVIYVVTISFFVWLVWDLSGLGTGGGSVLTRTKVGKINGRSIDIRTFDQRVQNVINDQQQRSSASLGLDEVNEIRDRVWEQVIQEVLFAQEYRRRGLTVSSAEIAEAIRNTPLPELQQSPELQTNGQFDPEKYQRWLASSVGQSLIPALEYQYREQLLQAKLFRAVVADVFVSDPLLWERYRDEREQVKVGLARIDPAANVSDAAAPVTAEETQAYYDRHRDELARDAAAFLSFVSVPRLPIASDSAAARARALELKGEIQRGTPFDEVARRESADTVSGRAGGDLGEMTRDQVVPEFASAVMTLPLGQVSDPVATQFGYHLLKVESRKGDTFRARHVLIPIEITGEHRDRLDALADSLETLAAEKLDRAALDTAARALGLTVRAVGPVAKGSRVFLPDGRTVPDAGVWAFQAQPEEHSSVIEAPDAFYVFRLDSLTEKRIPPFSQVRTEVEQRARLDKKAMKARELGDQLARQAAATGLARAAKDLGFEYQEVGPFARLTAPLPSPVLIGAAFGLARGAVSPSIEGETGPAGPDRGVYVLQVLEKSLVDSTDFAANLAAIRDQALLAARRSRVQAFVTALRASANVKDNRAEVYRTAAQAAEAIAPTLP
jgi:peptidyl-prolyl cis-trans isomerase D